MFKGFHRYLRIVIPVAPHCLNTGYECCRRRGQ